ncbi:MAG: biotin/lipoyl-binding protein [Chlorobiota bacterium]|nr:biotin/lipoyl-binding protein [Chlorobiota bacterium]QQS67360.1 MAG: biotin/lipoyl-binding protein [Chlorobiota bacterium]
MDKGNFKVLINNKTFELDKLSQCDSNLKLKSKGKFCYEENGKIVNLFIENSDEDNSFIAYINGEAINVRVMNKREERISQLRKNTQQNSNKGVLIISQMPGLIKEIFVKVGDSVKKGDPLYILEAMKMENEIKSPADMKVKRVIAIQGNALEKNGLIMELANDEN